MTQRTGKSTAMGMPGEYNAIAESREGWSPALVTWAGRHRAQQGVCQQYGLVLFEMESHGYTGRAVRSRQL